MVIHFRIPWWLLWMIAAGAFLAVTLLTIENGALSALAFAAFCVANITIAKIVEEETKRERKVQRGG